MGSIKFLELPRALDANQDPGIAGMTSAPPPGMYVSDHWYEPLVN